MRETVQILGFSQKLLTEKIETKCGDKVKKNDRN
jgi:hypothetical protein